jgi:hypothetical protein
MLAQAVLLLTYIQEVSFLSINQDNEHSFLEGPSSAPLEVSG